MNSREIQNSAEKCAAESTYEDLMKHISKNKTIPEALSKITPHDHGVQALLKAMTVGDWKSAVFDDENCDIYLLFLFKEKLIAGSQFCTVYFYLMILMQFTPRQLLATDHIQYKSLRPISVFTLTDTNGAMTDKGLVFIESIIAKLQKIGVLVDRERFKLFIKKLPATEKWIIEIPYATNPFNKARFNFFAMNLIPEELMVEMA